MNRFEDTNIHERRVCRKYIARAYNACRVFNAPTEALKALADAMQAIPLPEDDKENNQ